MTQIEQLISKIEEKLRNYKTALENTSYMTGQYVGLQAKIALCEELLEAARAILKEPASEDLEQAAEQAEQREGNLINGRFKAGFKSGAQWQKEQMMKDAVEAVVSQVPCANEIIFRNPASVSYWYLPSEMNRLGINKGDKVKVIIIKE